LVWWGSGGCELESGEFGSAVLRSITRLANEIRTAQLKLVSPPPHLSPPNAPKTCAVIEQSLK
jgi:hypothetical protein